MSLSKEQRTLWSLRSTRALVAAVATMMLAGGVIGWLVARRWQLPLALDYLVGTTLTVCVYVWYRADADERGYPRTMGLGGAMVLIWPLAVPYYLLRNRPSGQRLGALLRFAGVIVLCFAVAMLSSLLTTMVFDGFG